MDIKYIEKLIQLLKKHELAEIEVEEEKVGKVRISTGVQQVASVQPAMAVAAGQPQRRSADEAAAAAASPASSVPREKQIRSPLVGTFYEAASPGAEPFVRPGKAVRKGDSLCIIEAMKIMNEIEADRDGVIKEVLVQNGQPVEFDQVIFIIE